MKTLKLLFISCLLFTAIFLTSCTLPFFGQKKKAALQITSEPKATVFLNGEHLSQTPYFDENLKPGDYTLKLVPESSETSLSPWQAAIKLNPGIMTVVNRRFGETEEESSGYILTLEPIAEKDKARISVISTPDSVVVSLDAEPKGFTPLSLDEVEEGERVLNISALGYREETIKAKTIKGHKLIVNVQLAKIIEEKEEDEDEEATKSAERTESEATKEPETKQEASPSAKTEEAEIEKPYVKINDNPWGYLNVRSEPSTSGGTDTVITDVDPGDLYPYVDTSEGGWYKIEYEEDKMGWVSGKYATLYE